MEGFGFRTADETAKASNHSEPVPAPMTILTILRNPVPKKPLRIEAVESTIPAHMTRSSISRVPRPCKFLLGCLDGFLPSASLDGQVKISPRTKTRRSNSDIFAEKFIEL
jgi:hypothetical protein